MVYSNFLDNHKCEHKHASYKNYFYEEIEQPHNKISKYGVNRHSFLKLVLQLLLKGFKTYAHHSCIIQFYQVFVVRNTLFDRRR